MIPRRAGIAAVAALVLGVAACTSGGASPSSSPVQLQVYAAASLKKVMAALTAAYTAANPGVTLSLSSDSSAALETKIEQGAPADVFLSADTKNPGKLVDAGLATGDVTVFAGNLLTIAVPAANPAGITTPADLARAGVKVVAAGEGVPITRYATQLVANLASVSGYPGDFARLYAANIVSREDNVSAIVAKLALGEGDAGIVYVTDATGAGGITTVPVADSVNVPATYGGVAVKASTVPGAARAFLAWLTGPDAQAVFAEAGFTPAP
ncbi:MAG TPA: molybdate ABC transporter substrate-binding protein [Candidatus Limnocylindrales bacterium]|jgi:molybdate transport system substrate-binding protein